MDPPVKPDEGDFADCSSDSSILSEEWQDLSKSDFAKVIFCDINYDAENHTVGCKFQITDNVHEDPCDYVGLFKIGKSQCFVSKMLSETECEEDGKLLRCNFSDNGLPDGYYHFQYVTRDGEVCGASTPVEVKHLQPKEESSEKKLVLETVGKKYFPEVDLKEDSSDEDVVTESAENDFVVVEHILEKKNRMLEELLEKFRAKNLALSSDMEVLLEAKSKLCQEKEEVIELLHKEILCLKAEFVKKDSIIMERDNEIKCLSAKVQSSEQAAVKRQENLDTMTKLLDKCEVEKFDLRNEVYLLNEVIQDKERMPAEPEQRILLEQLEDQKFMIRALEDSKQLALKEMSDLSESLSKRTKVLNQTRSELASCKLKLKEADSVVEKQKVHIGKLVKKVDDLNNFEKVRKQACLDVKPASRNKDEIDLSKPVQELYSIAIAQAEKFLVLVDTLISKTDFHESFQEKSFHRLKIMFFVLLGKMKKPKDSICSREGSANSSPERKDRQKPVSRMLPSHQGPSFANFPQINNLKSGKGGTIEVEIVPTHTNIPTSNDSSASGYISHECHKLRFSKVNEILKAGIPSAKEEDLAFFKELWNGYDVRPKCILEGDGLKEYEVNDPISVLMTSQTREDMKRLEAILDVIEHEILMNEKPGEENEFFLEVLRASIKIEILLRYTEKVNKEASSEEVEKLKKKYVESDFEVGNLTIDVLNFKDKVQDLEFELTEATTSNLSMKKEIAEKDKIIKSVSEQKITLMEREIALLAIVKEHEARIKEAAELYKTMYLELDKLKRKLRRTKLVKTKAVAQEYSTGEDAYLLKPPELCEVPLKRARKMMPKSVYPKSPEKGAFCKAAEQPCPHAVKFKADKQPQMLKDISLKSIHLQNAEKVFAKSYKKGSPPKPHKRSPAADAKASATLEALIREKFSDTICKTLAANVPKYATELTFQNLPDYVPHRNGKQPRKTTPTKYAKAATRCVSDSDTGEHVLRNTTVSSTEGDKVLEKKQKSDAANSKLFEELSDEKPTISPIIEYFKSLDEKSSSPEIDVTLEPGNRDLRSVHKLLKEEITKAISPATENEIQVYNIPCVLCDKSLAVTNDLANLMDHLELEHQISMCPMCGQLFEAAFPKKYLMYHVEDHFKSE